MLQTKKKTKLVYVERFLMCITGSAAEILSSQRQFRTVSVLCTVPNSLIKSRCKYLQCLHMWHTMEKKRLQKKKHNEGMQQCCIHSFRALKVCRHKTHY